MRPTTLALALTVAVLDQASKWVILLFVMNPPRLIEVTPFFNLVLAYNTGIAFSIGAMGTRTSSLLFAGLAVAIVIGLIFWLRKQDRAWVQRAGALVIGGAVGNIVDRLIHPGVVDFLDFHWAGYHWPAFNLADSAIVIGVTLLIFDGLFLAPKPDKQRGY